LVFTV